MIYQDLRTLGKGVQLCVFLLGFEPWWATLMLNTVSTGESLAESVQCTAEKPTWRDGALGMGEQWGTRTSFVQASVSHPVSFSEVTQQLGAKDSNLSLSFTACPVTLP